LAAARLPLFLLQARNRTNLRQDKVFRINTSNGVSKARLYLPLE
jgi:hypothetical protein